MRVDPMLNLAILILMAGRTLPLDITTHLIAEGYDVARLEARYAQ